MRPCGEVHITLTRGATPFVLEAVVVEDLDCDILAGVPFMKKNKIVLDLPNDSIIIANKYHLPYSSNPDHDLSSDVRHSKSFLLRASSKEVILPGDFLELKSPPELKDDITIAVEPRCDSGSDSWIHPDLTKSIGGTVRIPNLSADAVVIRKHQHMVQVYYTTTANEHPKNVEISKPRHHMSTSYSQSAHCEGVSIDPDSHLSLSEQRAFQTLHERYDNVFNKTIGKYNDASGRVRAYINMGTVEPPPQKARLPSYSSEKMKLLQEKMDELEDLGVLVKPEDAGITVEYVSPSFLVKKEDGGHRLVTAFNAIGSYAKPIPSKTTTTGDVLRFLAGYRYIIKSDMTKQFFQLPMRKLSMKYLGVLTPFKGIRVYTRAAMGMPGSTEHLDELMTRVLGDLMEEGSVVKIADDIYVGADSIPELLIRWERLLQRFELNNLRLSATKTVVCPITTTILGWIWSSGTIKASPHKITPLATAEKPRTVTGLRSWCGAFKHLKACIPRYAHLLVELDSATAGKDSHTPIAWTDSLATSFHQAQQALNDIKSITIPQATDKLAVANGGIGSILYILRGDNMLLGGYFSARLKPHQRRWLPCEIEALAISAAVNHWAPYLVESSNVVQVLTDSKPCVQAYGKLCKGEFSTSARVSTFLSTLSKHRVSLQHIPGSANLPADYQSRNPMECDTKGCQVCKFIQDSAQATVYKLSIADVLEGKAPIPFLSHPAWKAMQQDCPSLRRTYAHLTQATRPNKKANNIRDVKRYLRYGTLGREGMIVVSKDVPFAPARDLIVVPRHIISGLLTALHLRLQHPSKTQLARVFDRHFYALDSDKEVATVSTQCSQCTAIATLPQEIENFSTSPPAKQPGINLACDIMCRARQRIFLVRDCFSSYTVTQIIPNEQKDTLRSAIIETTAELKSPTICTIRVDGATALHSLINDPHLKARNIKLEPGRLKNRNKNPIAEKAIQELEMELKKQNPEGGPLTPCQLAVATATLNSRVRDRGLSAREIIHQRDNITGEHS
jgi:hypothetical protein